MSSTAVPKDLGAPIGGALKVSFPGDPYAARLGPMLAESLDELEETLALLRAGITRLAEAERSVAAGARLEGAAAWDGGPSTLATPPTAADASAPNLLRWIEVPPERPTTAALARLLRNRIAGAVFAGHTATGARLPSIRDFARHTGVNHKTAGRVYEALAAEGVLELRPRSGAYVRQPGNAFAMAGETPDWIARMLAEASGRAEGVASLPELIARVLGASELSCACVDATEDLRVGLTSELRHRFGLRVYPLCCDEGMPGDRHAEDRLARDLDAVDLVVTTPWHTSISRITRAMGKPLAVVAPDPSSVAAVRSRLIAAPLQLVCADSTFGERFRSLQDPDLRDRLRVIALDDPDAVDRLDPSAAIVVTDAARPIISRDRAGKAESLSAQLGRSSSLEIARLIAGLINPW